MKETVFGSALRTKALVAVGLLGETYASELARLLNVRLFAVQRVLTSLEAAGVVAERKRGRTVLVTLNPRWFAYDELRDLILRFADVPEYRNALATRRRPRARSKPL